MTSIVIPGSVGEGVTIFLSTHTLDIAQELADRIGIIDQGRLLANGTMIDLQKQAARDGNLEYLFMKITEEVVNAEAAPSRE